MKYFIDTKMWRTDKFEIVDFDNIPENYSVWNIGRQNFPHPEFVPFAKPGNLPYHIDLTTLKCAKMPNEKTALQILKTASLHGMTKADVRRVLESRATE